MSADDASPRSPSGIRLPILLGFYTFTPAFTEPYVRASSYELRHIYYFSFFVPFLYFSIFTCERLLRRAWLDAGAACIMTLFTLLVLATLHKTL